MFSHVAVIFSDAWVYVGGVGSVFDEGLDFLMLILLMLVGLRARVCMQPYDGAAVATDCKQTNRSSYKVDSEDEEEDEADEEEVGEERSETALEGNKVEEDEEDQDNSKDSRSKKTVQREEKDSESFDDSDGDESGSEASSDGQSESEADLDSDDVSGLSLDVLQVAATF
jgi:hypothetical protein